MAKLIEDLIVIKVSRIVKDDSTTSVLETEQRALLDDSIPQLVEQLLNDTSVIVELAKLD
jgi:hypothetical protein